MKRLLLEIGAEEIPAGYIEPALKALEENLLKRLAYFCACAALCIVQLN